MKQYETFAIIWVRIAGTLKIDLKLNKKNISHTNGTNR